LSFTSCSAAFLSRASRTSHCAIKPRCAGVNRRGKCTARSASRGWRFRTANSCHLSGFLGILSFRLSLVANRQFSLCYPPPVPPMSGMGTGILPTPVTLSTRILARLVTISVLYVI
jgi:hypothetical protein